jgi:hypothetical protein
MYKYLDITKPDNGIRIHTNIDIDKCKFEPCSSEVYSIQHYVITSVHDLRQIFVCIRIPLSGLVISKYLYIFLLKEIYLI